MKNRKILLIAIACAIPIALAGLWVALHYKRKPDRPLRIWVAAFSPDGRTIVSTGGTQSGNQPADACEVLRWDAKTGKRKELMHQAATVRSIAWSPDGKFIVLGDWGGATKLMNPITGKIVGNLTPHATVVNSVAVSADSKVVASACVDGTVTVCEATGKELNTFSIGNDKFMSVALAPDGSSLAAGAAFGKAYVYKVSRHDEPMELLAFPDAPHRGEHRVEAVAYSPDGQTLVTACRTHLRLWNVTTGKLIREFNDSATDINYATFSPDGAKLATIDSQGTLTLWNSTTGEQANWTSAHQCTSFSVSFSGDGRRIVTAGRDDFMLNVWDAQTLSRVASFHRKANQ